MPIEAIVPRRLYRQVADQLRQLFDDGEYLPGDRLPTERELAEKMGISRPTIREALIALEVEGRVRIRVGSGIYVTEPPGNPPPLTSEEGPFELLSAREFIEGNIAEEAARHVTPEHIAVLDDVLGRMAGQKHPSRTTITLDRQFHIGIATVLGNAVLVRVVGELFDQRMNPFFERLSSYFEDRATWEAALEEHRAVRDAIAARDPGRAKAAMQQHLRLSQLRFSGGFGEKSAVRSDGGESRASRIGSK
jgi:DNA-binding FadR family transcriptional regulator